MGVGKSQLTRIFPSSFNAGVIRYGFGSATGFPGGTSVRWRSPHDAASGRFTSCTPVPKSLSGVPGDWCWTLGMPGGLAFHNRRLKELREKGQIAFFETCAREVILYFRELEPLDVKKIAIDLVATVPGSYTGPSSSAYLYYNDTGTSWAAPLAIGIAP